MRDMSEQPENIVEKVKKEEREVVEDGKVIIKMDAFRNMITHVLRFGNDALDSSVEVMGICMGKKSPKGEIIVETAIPISHGTNVEVGFSQEDYIAFAAIDEKYSGEGLYAVGWYHSHPQWGLFFSDSDVKNHLFYQKEQTPHGFGIVFDHSLMGKEGKLGFDVYRLKDYTKGPQSDYVRVAHEIEVPSKLDYFKWVQKFVEDSQKKSPVLIKEVNEASEVSQESLQAIPGTEDLQEIPAIEDEFPKISPIISGFTEGSTAFSDIFLNPFKAYLGKWSNDVAQGALKGSETLAKTLGEMTEAISLGLTKVQNWFEKNVEEIIDEFKTDVSEYLDVRVNAQKELANEIPEIKKKIISDIGTLMEEKIKDFSEKLTQSASNTSEKLIKSKETTSKLNESTNSNSETLTALNNQVQSLSEGMVKDIESSSILFETNMGTEIEKLSEEMTELKTLYSQMNENFKKLQKVVMEFRNI